MPIDEEKLVEIESRMQQRAAVRGRRGWIH